MKLNIPSASGYLIAEDEGTPVTARSNINFVGAGVSVADAGGKTVVTIAGGAGSGAVGTSTVDFGAFPGKSDTSVAVTGQASILAGSVVQAWIRPVATSDHSADEHMVETIEIVAGNIVAGTGFTIYAFNDNQINEPALPFTRAGNGTRLYGQFTVAWEWS